MVCLVKVYNKLPTSYGLGVYDAAKGGFPIRAHEACVVPAMTQTGISIGFNVKHPQNSRCFFKMSEELAAFSQFGAVVCQLVIDREDVYPITVMNYTESDLQIPKGFVFGYLGYKVGHRYHKIPG